MLRSGHVKIVLFAPFANIWEHSFPESLVAEEMVSRGAEVTVLRCGTMLKPHCVAMSAAGVSASAPAQQRDRVCQACVRRRDLLDSTMPFTSVVMDGLVSEADRHIVARAVDEISPANWEEWEIDGVPLGRYSAYEFLLDHKVVGSEMPSALWPEYLSKFEQSLLTFLVARRLLSDVDADRVVVYNRLYAVNHAFCAAAESLGIATYTIQGGGHIVYRGETLTMFRGTESLDDVFHTKEWAAASSAPISSHGVDVVREHIDGLLQGSSAWAYSSEFEASQPSDLRKRFDVSSDRPVLLAAMSSEDEVNAARLADALPQRAGTTSLFADQFEWLAYLFRFAADNPDVQIIVRMHPRMFPNKREAVRSPVADRILALLDDRPSNIRLNLPSDNVSLYDVMQIVDVLLNFRSSAGLEFSAFGIPVVMPANRDFFTYPPEINRVGRTEPEYGAQIKAAIAEGWSLDRARAAFRWWAFQFTRIAVDLSASVRSRPSAARPKTPGLRLRLWRAMVWIVLQRGPLIRERLALRRRQVAPDSAAILHDVLLAGRGSLAESPEWPAPTATAAEEERALRSHFDELCTGRWASITDTDSLAGRIRRELGAVHPA